MKTTELVIGCGTDHPVMALQNCCWGTHPLQFPTAKSLLFLKTTAQCGGSAVNYPYAVQIHFLHFEPTAMSVIIFLLGDLGILTMLRSLGS